jgi:hypothetical protein
MAKVDPLGASAISGAKELQGQAIKEDRVMEDEDAYPAERTS